MIPIFTDKKTDPVKRIELPQTVKISIHAFGSKVILVLIFYSVTLVTDDLVFFLFFPSEIIV